VRDLAARQAADSAAQLASAKERASTASAALHKVRRHPCVGLSWCLAGQQQYLRHLHSLTRDSTAPRCCLCHWLHESDAGAQRVARYHCEPVHAGGSSLIFG